MTTPTIEEMRKPTVDELLDDLVGPEHEAWRQAWKDDPRLGWSIEDWHLRRWYVDRQRLASALEQLEAARRALRMVRKYYDDQRPVDLYQSEEFASLLDAALPREDING